MSSDHIIKSYDDELTKLQNTLIAMGGLAEAQLASAIQAVVKRDSDLAAIVVAGDARADQLEREVEARVDQQLQGRLKLTAATHRLGYDGRQVAAGAVTGNDPLID